jgi:predicted ATPase/transcriptional regulator with XRE-family HTH domain
MAKSPLPTELGFGDPLQLVVDSGLGRWPPSFPHAGEVAMDGPTSFGEWLRQRREALHLSRPELARRASCSVAALRKIEFGERRPSRELAELLAKALNLPPEACATFIRVARGELGLERLRPNAAADAQLSAASPSARGLPVALTPLIGREAELTALARLLADPTCRLLTIAGPGGIGKTRLAVEAAGAHAAVQPAYFVALAPLSSPEFIAPAIADVLSLKFSGPADPTAQLVRYLRDKSLLLVLDNFEHVLNGANLAAAILQGAPGVKLLVTSRERLDLHGEWVFELHGLPLPAAQAGADWVQSPAESTSSAVALFVQSARRARTGFEPQAEEWLAVARICRLVAGVPLAIELAATWVRVLACAEIAAEIERSVASDPNLEFLATSRRDVPERHRSMRAVIDHSWKLLSAGEQRALAQLAVFRGGFTREAAEHVAGTSLAQLLALVDKSLVQRAATARYDLHELVRQYAAARLATEAPHEQAARERHSLYYLGWLQDRDARLKSHDQREAVADLTGEMDNLRAGWDWAAANRQFMPLYRASAALMYLLEVCNWFKEGEATFGKTAAALQAGLAESEADTLHPVILNAMLAHAGFFRLRLGRCEEAYRTLAPCAAFLRANAEPATAIYSLWYLGINCWILGNFAEAQESLQDCLHLARAEGMRWHEAAAGEFLGGLAVERGERDQARRYLSEAFAVLRRLGDPSLLAHALGNLGMALRVSGDTREAEKRLRESLELAREIDYRFAMGFALDGLGEVAYAEGRYDEAHAFFAESAGLLREMGDTYSLSRTLNHQGLNALALGDPAGARSHFNAALRLAYAGQFLPSVLAALAGLAALDTGPDAGPSALELVLIVLQHPASSQETKDRAAQLRAELEARLPQAAIKAAQQRARSSELAEVVRSVLASA